MLCWFYKTTKEDKRRCGSVAESVDRASEAAFGVVGTGGEFSPFAFPHYELTAASWASAFADV